MVLAKAFAKDVARCAFARLATQLSEMVQRPTVIDPGWRAKNTMTIRTTLPPRGRDYRLDLLRGFANWAIYLDHIPNNVVNWVTQRNYGFSDAADLFVFISGYTASFVYARIMLERGFVIGGTRLIRRAWKSMWRISSC